MEKIFTEKVLTKAALKVFQYLFKLDGFKALVPFMSRSKPQSGQSFEELVKISDENHSLTGLFLKGNLESVRDRNSRANQTRWFEESFRFNDDDLFLSTQWNANGNYQLTVDDLNYFLKKLYNDNLSLDRQNNAFIFMGHLSKSSEKINSFLQQIFFGAPGTGKSYKVDEIVQQGVAARRKNDFVKSDISKCKHYADVLSNQEKFGCDIWSIDSFEVLNQKLDAVDSDDNVSNPEHSALNAYIKFLNDYNPQCVFRTTFHPDYDYAQFVGSYKPQAVGKLNGKVGKEELKTAALNFKNDEFSLYKYSALYSESLLDYDIAAKMDIVKDSELGKKQDGSPKDQATFSVQMNTGVALGNYLKSQMQSAITYSFVPQVFANAYKAAWEKFIAADKKSTADNQVYLVIEEINRGNCAQIFGDIFQLLDRDDDGYSRYEIDADADFGEWLEKQGLSRQLQLPPNFNILATMNTSDQSLFPMDSAFKRRFDWEYVPIRYQKDDACGPDWNADQFEIVLGEKKYRWLEFLEKVNENIFETAESEDKQMGEFFVKPKDGKTIDLDMFLSKVMFYLWDSVYKDEVDKKTVFRFDWDFGSGKKLPVTFQRLFMGNKQYAAAILQHMMEEKLGVAEFKE